MYNDYRRDPKEFKHEMRSDYQMTAKMCLKFIVALEKLIDHNWLVVVTSAFNPRLSKQFIVTQLTKAGYHPLRFSK